MNNDKSKAQTLFDNALFGIREQGKGAVVASDVPGTFTCRYLTPDGCKCAIGQSIPPDQYLPAFEGQTLWHKSTVFTKTNDITAWFLETFGEENRELGIELQSAHDSASASGSFKGTSWEVNMLRIAKAHRLTYTRVDGSNHLDELGRR